MQGYCFPRHIFTRWLKCLLLISCIGFSHGLLAQHSFKDTIASALKNEGKFFVGFHNRNTFIQSNQTKLYGLVGGMDYQKVKLFVGVYGFGNANETLLTNDSRFTQDSVFRFVNSSNFNFGIEYQYYQYKRLYLSLPIQIGIGNIKYDYRESNKTTVIRSEFYNIVPIEVGTNAYLELLPWAGVKAGIGYRITLGPTEESKLTSPYYNLGLAILVGEIYKEIKTSIRSKD